MNKVRASRARFLCLANSRPVHQVKKPPDCPAEFLQLNFIDVRIFKNHWDEVFEATRFWSALI